MADRLHLLDSYQSRGSKGPSSDMEGICLLTAQMVQAAIPSSRASVLFCNAIGSLQPLWPLWNDISIRPDLTDGRQIAFNSNRCVGLRLEQPVGFGVTILPLRVGLKPLALLEVAAPRNVLQKSQAFLGLVAGQTSLGLGAVEMTDRGRKLDSTHGSDRSVDMAVTSVAHELREPLLSAKTAIESVLEANREHQIKARALLERSCEELARLSQLTTALLELPQLHELPMRPTDLVSAVEAAVNSYSRPHGEKRLLIDVRGRPAVWGHPDLLRVAISNIVRNALSYSSEDSSVVIEVVEGHERHVISISNHGPAIAPSERASIFKPYTRGESGRRMTRGSGLGLAIAKRIVEAHGGSLRLTRRERTTFRMELPLLERDAT
jgi:signal transduction histidine kinase